MIDILSVREYAHMNMTEEEGVYCEKLENAIEQALSCIDIEPDKIDEVLEKESIGARIDLTEIDNSITKEPTSMQALYFLDTSVNGWTMRFSMERRICDSDKKNIFRMECHIYVIASVRR